MMPFVCLIRVNGFLGTRRDREWEAVSQRVQRGWDRGRERRRGRDRRWAWATCMCCNNTRSPWLAQVFGEQCFSNPILWRVWERTHNGERSAQVGLARVLKALFWSKSASGLQRKTQRPQTFPQPLSGCLAHAHVQSQLCFIVAAIIKHCLAKACYLLCKYVKIQNVKKTDNRLAHSYTPTLLVVQWACGIYSNSAALFIFLFVYSLHLSLV